MEQNNIMMRKIAEKEAGLRKNRGGGGYTSKEKANLATSLSLSESKEIIDIRFSSGMKFSQHQSRQSHHPNFAKASLRDKTRIKRIRPYTASTVKSNNSGGGRSSNAAESTHIY